MSLLAPLLKPQSLSATSKITTRSIPLCLHQKSDHRNRYRIQRQQDHDDTGERAAAQRRETQRSVEDYFITALVTAGFCHRHRPRASSNRRQREECNGTGRTHSSIGQTRSFSKQAIIRQTQPALTRDAHEPEISRDEYKSLVDTYWSYATHPPPKAAMENNAKLKVLPGHQSLAPRLVLTAEQEQAQAEREVLPPENKEHARRIKDFHRLLRGKPGRVNLEDLWTAYEALQTPRPRYLHRNTLKLLFHHMTWIEYYHERGVMEKYFTLLNECLETGLYLTEYIWTSAIAFAGRWIRNVSSDEVKSAVETWMRMEQDGHQANLVTFSVLFHIAVRAGRFGLADTIFSEVKQRGLVLDRVFRANVIYYAGMRRDGDAVRQAFRELVNDGEIVDTHVMNTVIVSLFRAGEFASAENVFLRMKALHEEKLGTEAPHDWRTRKEMAKLLNRTGRELRKRKEDHGASFFGTVFSTDDRREQIQKVSPIAPDSRTYQILIKHHVYTSAELARVKVLLGEMYTRELEVHGSVYVHILRGFQAHGGYLSAGWDRASLEEIWQSILAAMGFTEMEPEPETPSATDPEPKLEADSPSQPMEKDDYDLLGAMMSQSQGYTPFSAEPVPRDEEPPEIQLDVEQMSKTEKAELEGKAFGDVAEFEAQVHITKGLALAAINAFYRCAGKGRMLQVWKEIQSRWKHGSRDDKLYVQSIVDRLAAEDIMYNV